MPRARRASDDLYNARRRARRQAERLEKQGFSKAASSLREVISKSYGKGATVGVTQLDTITDGTKQTQPITLPVTRDINQSASATRKPRAKRLSDEIYNARRRLRRQAAKLEREAAQAKGSEKSLLEGYASFLREQAEATKGKKLTKSERFAEVERLGHIRQISKEATYGRFKIARRNAIFMQQLNAAGTEGATSGISERKKSVFWAATKGLWPKGSNVPRNERYEKIASHFFNENTRDAQEFRQWLRDKKGIEPANVYGDLQLIFEYITEELNNPSQYDLPDLPYGAAMDLIKTAM